MTLGFSVRMNGASFSAEKGQSLFDFEGCLLLNIFPLIFGSTKLYNLFTLVFQQL